NNVLAFPGVFRGALDSCTRIITDEHKLAAAKALAALLKKPTRVKIIVPALDKRAMRAVSSVFKKRK
ncbi:NAD-dependent malic enzyme, partial [Patescibacteria group bacterium]